MSANTDQSSSQCPRSVLMAEPGPTHMFSLMVSGWCLVSEKVRQEVSEDAPEVLSAAEQLPTPDSSLALTHCVPQAYTGGQF